jgi:glucuronoarabinoxylan endo-1,4-beta-xylanase
MPWQITENRKSTHGIMLMSEYTPKTYTAMHYSRFIRPGAVRIDAQPGFGDVQVSAFLHEANGELAVIAINPTEQEQAMNLTFRNLKTPASLKVYRTSATKNMQQVGEVAVSDNKAAFRMMPWSIVTFSGKI